MNARNLVFGLVMAAWACGCASAHERSTPRTWQGIVKGMNRVAVHRMVGPPDAPSTSPFEEIWVTREWELDVAYDHFGRVTNVVQQYQLR